VKTKKRCRDVGTDSCGASRFDEVGKSGSDGGNGGGQEETGGEAWWFWVRLQGFEDGEKREEAEGETS